MSYSFEVTVMSSVKVQRSPSPLGGLGEPYFIGLDTDGRTDLVG